MATFEGIIGACGVQPPEKGKRLPVYDLPPAQATMAAYAGMLPANAPGGVFASHFFAFCLPNEESEVVFRFHRPANSRYDIESSGILHWRTGRIAINMAGSFRNR